MSIHPEQKQPPTDTKLFDLSDIKTRQAWVLCTAFIYLGVSSAVVLIELISNHKLFLPDIPYLKLKILIGSALAHPTVCALLVLRRKIISRKNDTYLQSTDTSP